MSDETKNITRKEFDDMLNHLFANWYGDYEQMQKKYLYDLLWKMLKNGD